MLSFVTNSCSKCIRHKMCSFEMLLVCFHLLLILAANAQAQKTLGFTSANSSFKIAIFADLHYGENAWSDWGPQNDQSSTKVMSTLLDDEKPDFVVFLGDVITANNLLVRNATKYWEQAISPTRSRSIPWASVFGNQDDAAFEWENEEKEWLGSVGLPSIQCPNSSLAAGVEQMVDCYFQRTTRAELMQMDAQQSLSHSSFGPQSLWPSVSNYVLEIASYKNPTSPAALLYFLDSGGSCPELKNGSCTKSGSYPGLISEIQGKWFQQTAAQKNPDSRIPEIVFWHIPSQAYKDVAPPPGYPIKDPCVGSLNEGQVASQDEELGIMDILTNRTSVKAVFVGHNHGLDWCCPSKNQWLCYARHTGYGGYGTWPKGARILELVEENFQLKSWIRMEDGTIHSNITITSA
ncbi:probable inactive purple acid phosphatase 16 [Cryptomeria japonica]|uniref:probable inactive purple acid phosphatase 16 n=1 Tax=Cryptomeria japonica TaxID=3369 RepID=UPI0027DA9791|nr:probable inactive purple acid phosphatase 16 [Cryptomeria japonica]